EITYRAGRAGGARVQQPVRLPHAQGARLGLLHDRRRVSVRPVPRGGASLVLPPHAARVPGRVPGRWPLPDEAGGRRSPAGRRAAGRRGARVWRGAAVGRPAAALHGAGVREAPAIELVNSPTPLTRIVIESPSLR